MTHIFNTSFFADEQFAPQALEWIRHNYMAHLKSNDNFEHVVLTRLTDQVEPGMVTYSCQARCRSIDHLEEWIDNQGADLLDNLSQLANGKVVCFTSTMEIIDL